MRSLLTYHVTSKVQVCLSCWVLLGSFTWRPSLPDVHDSAVQGARFEIYLLNRDRTRSLARWAALEERHKCMPACLSHRYLYHRAAAEWAKAISNTVILFTFMKLLPAPVFLPNPMRLWLPSTAKALITLHCSRFAGWSKTIGAGKATPYIPLFFENIS